MGRSAPFFVSTLLIRQGTKMWKNKIAEIKNNFEAGCEKVDSLEKWKEFRDEFLSRKRGELTQLLQAIKEMPEQERRDVQELKLRVEERMADMKAELDVEVLK